MNYEEYLKNIRGYSDSTIGIYSRYAFLLEANGLDYYKVMKKIENTSNNTKRLALSAIKKYYTFIKDERRLEIELPKKSHRTQMFVSFEQYRQYLTQINSKTRMGYMKYIIIRLLFETGLRASELLWIRRQDIENDSIKIIGKGGNERIVRMSKWLTSDLQKYISHSDTRRIFNFGYKNLYQKIALLDKTRKLTPHMFRRGYAKYCYQNGVSIYDISLSMGHNDINTTALYINKNSRDINISSIF